MKTESVVLFTVESREFKALLMAAATADVYYLNGVHADTVNKRLVATDGHVALMSRLEREAIPEGCEPFHGNRSSRCTFVSESIASRVHGCATDDGFNNAKKECTRENRESAAARRN